MYFNHANDSTVTIKVKPNNSLFSLSFQNQALNGNGDMLYLESMIAQIYAIASVEIGLLNTWFFCSCFSCCIN